MRTPSRSKADSTPNAKNETFIFTGWFRFFNLQIEILKFQAFKASTLIFQQIQKMAKRQ